MKKKFLALALVLVMLFAMLAGCSNNESEQPGNNDNPGGETNTNNPSSGNDVVPGGDNDVVGGDAVNTDYIRPEIRFNLDRTNVNPLAMRSASQVTYSIFEMLYTTENGIGSAMIPVLADANRGGNNSLGLKGMDHEDGSTDYTFYIYDYITDSEGNKITASDVKFCFEQTLAYGQASGWGSIESWEAVDDTTMVMHCSRELDQKGELENILLRCYIFSEAAYNASESDFNTDAVGTGPYVISEFVQDASITCVAREDYWQTNEELRPRSQQANVAKFTGVVVADSNTAVTALQSHDLDLVSGLGAGLVAPFADGGAYDSEYDVYGYAQNGIRYLVLNCSEDSIMSDPNMRLAIYYALSNENLANVLNAMGSTPAYFPLTAYGHALFSDYLTKWDSETNYVTEFDVEKSKQYAEAAGYNNEEIVLLSQQDTTGIVENMQTMLINAGFNVKLDQWDFSTVSSLVADSTKWDIYYNQTNSSDYTTSLWSHVFQITSNSVGTENFIDDDEFDALLNAALTVGSTDADMDAFWQYTVDNAYFYPLVRGNSCLVYPAGQVSSIWLNDKNQFVPGAAYYVEG